MKNFSILVSLLFLSISVSGQNFKEWAAYQFTDAADYTQQEANVLKCANYMFETPFNKNDLNRLYATQFVIKWMEGTPTHTFEIGEDAMKLTKGNTDMLGLYFMALAKTALDHPKQKLSKEEMHAKAQSLLIAYCSEKDNNLKPTRRMKKLMKKEK